jgi:hypothetical protein
MTSRSPSEVGDEEPLRVGAMPTLNGEIDE